MSTQRRHLVQRNRNPEASSPAPRTQNRASETASRQPTSLPPYEAPTCPLSDEAKRNIENLRIERDSAKYKGHILGAIKALQNAAPDCHERVSQRKAQLKKQAEREARQDGEEPTAEYKELVGYVPSLEKQVDKFTKDADKALRDLIDYGDELAMQDTILRDVVENVTAAAAAQPGRGKRRCRSASGEDDAEASEEEAPADDVEVLSTVELLKTAKEDYTTKYQARTMRARYAENNEYKQFKQGIHEAANPGDNAPPMPHARTWFPEENDEQTGSSSRRRRNNTTDNTNNNDEEDEDDDEVQIFGFTQNLKCPLTLQSFREPYSNNKCKHTFEKSAIVEYINDQGTVFHPPQRAGQARKPGHKQAKCPQTGCERMLALDDFHDDVLILRKVLRKQKEDAQQQEDDPDDLAPRGTQRNRPEHVDDDQNSDGVDIEEDRATKQLRIKRERQQSRGPSMTPGQSQLQSFEAEAEDEEMDDV